MMIRNKIMEYRGERDCEVVLEIEAKLVSFERIKK